MLIINLLTQLLSLPQARKLMSHLKNINSLGIVYRIDCFYKLFRPVQKRRVTTIKQQVANMLKFSGQITQINKDSTLEKSSQIAKETAKDAKNNISVIPRSSPRKKKLEVIFKPVWVSFLL